jgi:hypothetical protein
VSAFITVCTQNLDNEQNNNEQSEPVGIKHKTSSLFIKSLPALLTREDLLEVARRYPGFLRAAASEADPRNHFSRRCWLSFERNSAKIREICFALNNVQVKGFDLAPLVNKDLTRRIRPTSEKFCAATIMHRDLTAVCQIAAFQDAQVGLWKAEGEGEVVRNPLLAEAELLKPEESIEEVKSVLDKLLLYLRVVHSIDYYNQVLQLGIARVYILEKTTPPGGGNISRCHMGGKILKGEEKGRKGKEKGRK